METSRRDVAILITLVALSSRKRRTGVEGGGTAERDLEETSVLASEVYFEVVNSRPTTVLLRDPRRGLRS